MNKIIFIITALLPFFSAFAYDRLDTVIIPQGSLLLKTDSVTVVTSHGRYMFNNFWDNWYISAGAGIQMYMGDEDKLKPVGERITPTYELAVGKWLHPVVGFRAQAGGGPVKGYSTGTLPVIGHSLITSGPDADGVYIQEWDQIYVEGQLLFDMNNIIGGYKRERVYSVLLFAGAGVCIALDQPKDNGDRTAIVSFGLINRFRVAKYFDINLEIKNAVVNQNYDREQSQKYYEAMPAITAGVTFRFGEAGDRLFRKAADTRTVISQHYIGPQPPPVVQPKPDTVYKTEPAIQPITRTLTTPIAVFFELDKAIILPRDKINISFIANIINASGNEKFRIIGSADSKTGTPSHNQALSLRRCQAVRDHLVNEHGVDPGKLVLEPLGGIEKYSPHYVNRAVVVTQIK